MVIVAVEIKTNISLEMRQWLKTRHESHLSVVHAIDMLKEHAKLRDELKMLYAEHGMFHFILEN